MAEALKFNECTLLKLDKMFGLKQIHPCAKLDEWLNREHEISDWERQNLLFFRQNLIRNTPHWHEIELAYNFIGPIMVLVDFTTDRSNFFADRSFAGTVDDVDLSGKPDGMIASGFREPEKPYFCFQEYKRHLDPQGDPAGQALAAMLVAQEINQHQHPVYGCYVVGDMWRFMLLQDREYGISASYSATGEGIFDIFRTLKVLKRFVMELTD